MRLAAFASLKFAALTVQLARDVLSDVIPPQGYRPSIERIQEAVAAHYGLTVAKLTSRLARAEGRPPAPGRDVPLPRASREEKLQSIAEKFNKKDHTTVIAAVDRVKGLLESDEAIRSAVIALTAKLALVTLLLVPCRGARPSPSSPSPCT